MRVLANQVQIKLIDYCLAYASVGKLNGVFVLALTSVYNIWLLTYIRLAFASPNVYL